MRTASGRQCAVWLFRRAPQADRNLLPASAQPQISNFCFSLYHHVIAERCGSTGSARRGERRKTKNAIKRTIFCTFSLSCNLSLHDLSDLQIKSEPHSCILRPVAVSSRNELFNSDSSFSTGFDVKSAISALARSSQGFQRALDGPRLAPCSPNNRAALESTNSIWTSTSCLPRIHFDCVKRAGRPSNNLLLTTKRKGYSSSTFTEFGSRVQRCPS